VETAAEEQHEHHLAQFTRLRSLINDLVEKTNLLDLQLTARHDDFITLGEVSFYSLLVNTW